MLCALAYVAVVVGRIPLILFLKYDPQDVIIAIGGLIWGPLLAFIVSFIVSFIEMISISGNGILGFIMNVISSCTFACTAAFIYKRRHTLSGAYIALFSGWFLMVVVMLLWNYLITPIYMGYPREAVVKLLLPAFLPFNLIKGGLNTAITLLLYKPIENALRNTNLIPSKTATSPTSPKSKKNIGVLLVALFIFTTCILLLLSLKGII
jgi:riboflavin transporter FmnP